MNLKDYYKKNGIIVLGKGTKVRNIKYWDKVKKIKRRKKRKQKGGFYFADHVLKNTKKYLQKGKGFVNKYIGNWSDPKTGKQISDRVMYAAFKKKLKSTKFPRRRSYW